MNSEVPRDNAVVAQERAAPRGSGTSILVHVLWGLTGALLGVVIGAAGVGDNLIRHFLDSGGRDQRAVELSARLEELRGDLTARERELAQERLERKEAAASLKRSIETAEWNALAAQLRSDFLGRYLTHEQARSEASRKQLVDVLCSLRRQEHVARLKLVGGPLEISPEELRRSARPEIEEIMIQRGISRDLIERARRDPQRIVIPAVTAFNVFEVQRAAQARRAAMRDAAEAHAALLKQAQAIRVTRAVLLADGAEYSVPRDVAVQMLQRPDCQIE